MDMRRYAGEKYIKLDDVRNGSLHVQIVLVREGKFERAEAVFQTGEVLGLNATNTWTLMRAYGPDSEDWVGKDIELDLGQVEFQKKLQDSVIVKPISPPITSAQKAAAVKIADKDSDLDDDIPFS